MKRKAETSRTNPEEVRSLCELMRSERGTYEVFNRILHIAEQYGIDTTGVDFYDPVLGSLCEELLHVLDAEDNPHGMDEGRIYNPLKRRFTVPPSPQLTFAAEVPRFGLGRSQTGQPQVERFQADPDANYFESMPEEVQEMFWIPNLVAPTVEAMVDKRNRFGTISKTQSRIQEEAIRELAKTARPWPTVHKIQKGSIGINGVEYPTSIESEVYATGGNNCTDLGFPMADCKFNNITWPKFEVSENRETFEMIAGFVMDMTTLRNRVAWDCSCVSIRFPVSMYFGWYTVVPYYRPKGYFTVADLIKIVADYLYGTFDAQELSDMKNLSSNSHSVSPQEQFNSIFSVGYDRTLWSDLQAGTLKRYRALVGFTFNGFSLIETVTGNYLATKWTRTYTGFQSVSQEASSRY